MILKRGREENKADFSFGYELLFPLFLNISGGKNIKEETYHLPRVRDLKNVPFAKSSSSFLLAAVPGSLATRAGLAFACSAA